MIILARNVDAQKWVWIQSDDRWLQFQTYSFVNISDEENSEFIIVNLVVFFKSFRTLILASPQFKTWIDIKMNINGNIVVIHHTTHIHLDIVYSFFARFKAWIYVFILLVIQNWGEYHVLMRIQCKCSHSD